ncbi:hypothetical protein KP509_27G039500 [Ceratopteris richardii]|uniref:Uncharacterized protein n=1 Tax=Ceratopteris richardii TaxID=49495 RepID=A0A8T2RFR3_CERRI|nr:hypothetical protein KP509_27G039500 [Ceratopteris richardii]
MARIALSIDDELNCRTHKRNNYILKMPIACSKCCLSFISFFDPYNIVSSLNVNLCEELFFPKAFQELCYEW